MALNAARYIVDLASRGRHHFTTEEAAVALGGSVPTTRAALRRLKAKGEIADPFRGFHVIVPPEYRRLGCLPAEQFVPQLMRHLDAAYYVALLSAAELHGAAHQRPQAFQVMVKTNRRAIACGRWCCVLRACACAGVCAAAHHAPPRAPCVSVTPSAQR